MVMVRKRSTRGAKHSKHMPDPFPVLFCVRQLISFLTLLFLNMSPASRVKEENLLPLHLL